MNEEDHHHYCARCHQREKFYETFKKCFYCSKKHCNQCWTELQNSDDVKLLIDILPRIDVNQNNKRICSACLPILLQHTLKNFEHSKPEKDKKKKNIDEDYQLALAISLSQQEAEEKTKLKRKFEEEEDVLSKISEAVEKFLNRAKSNFQRNRDALSDTAVLSALISLQTYANELEQYKRTLHHQRQHFETLQEKLTALRDAREALNILRFEHTQKKRQEQEQRRVLMIEKIAELRRLKHSQIINYQQNYFQHFLADNQFDSQ